jgi:hypothetical protein
MFRNNNLTFYGSALLAMHRVSYIFFSEQITNHYQHFSEKAAAE